MAKACHYFGKTSFHAAVSEHLKYCTWNTCWAPPISVRSSALGWSEGCDRQAALVLEPLSAELSEKSSLQRLQGHHPIHRNERGICPSHRGAAFCAANRYHTSCVTVCDIFKNSINLSSVPATLICVWQYLFPLKSPPALRTAVTRQNYTLHTLLKWQGLRWWKTCDLNCPSNQLHQGFWSWSERQQFWNLQVHSSHFFSCSNEQCNLESGITSTFG